MEMIRVYNRKTGEVLEKTFTNPEDADDYEVTLDFLMAEYERYHDGERLYLMWMGNLLRKRNRSHV